MRFLAFIPLLTASLLACTPESGATESGTGDPTTDGSSTTGDPTDSGTGSASEGSSTEATGSTGDPTTGEPPDTTSTTGELTTSGTDATSTTDATSSSTGEPLDDCGFLAFKLFESDDEHECGLGPNGVELCHWTISFTVDAYEHHYSDIGEQGTYTCEGGVISALDGGQNAHGGTIDADTGALVWDDVAYHEFK